MSGLRVSVIVPVRATTQEHLEQFARCLGSLGSFSETPQEILVVLDGEGAGNQRAGDMAAGSGAKVLQLSRPGGPSAARNAGAKEATGDILFFVDADCEAAPDCLRIITNLFESESTLDAVFGSYDDAPGSPNFLSQYKNLMHHYTHQNSAEEASTFWGACGAIRREVFLRSGGFDERFWFLEDIDLGYRLKKDKHRIQLKKNLYVKHLKRYTAASLLKSDFCHRALPWTHLILRQKKQRENLQADLNIDKSSRASVVLSFLLLVSLLFARRSRIARGVASLCGVALLFLNRRPYVFLGSKRGGAFAAMAIFWHWLYFLYGGLGFVVGLIQFYSGKEIDHRPR